MEWVIRDELANSESAENDIGCACEFVSEKLSLAFGHAKNSIMSVERRQNLEGAGERQVANNSGRGLLVSGEQGFTLVELMLVVAIAGVLLTLAEPSFHGAIVKAREAALKQNLFTMREVIDQYKADRGKFPPALVELKTAGYLKRIPMDPFTRSDASWQELVDQVEGGVFDVHSGSDLVALDGTPYNQW